MSPFFRYPHQSPACVVLLSHACRIHHPSHALWLEHPNETLQGVQTSGVPRNLFGGRFNKFSWGQRERGSGGGSPLVRGSGGSCNLV
jgi:hypothetical protein